MRFKKWLEDCGEVRGTNANVHPYNKVKSKWVADDGAIPKDLRDGGQKATPPESLFGLIKKRMKKKA